MKQFVKDRLSTQSSAVTLAYVASLERKLTKHFQVQDFLSLQQGSFLEFLVKHNQVVLHLFIFYCFCYTCDLILSQ